MVHRQVVHNVVESVEHLVAQLLRFGVLPHADHVLLDRLGHVAIVGRHVVLAVDVAVVVTGGFHATESEWICCCCCSVEGGAEHGGVGRVRQEVPGVGWHWRGVVGLGMSQISRLAVRRKWFHFESHVVCHYHCHCVFESWFWFWFEEMFLVWCFGQYWLC